MTKPATALLTAATAATLLAGCGGSGYDLDEELACENAGAVEVVCGLDNPEDIVVVPGGDYLIVSQYGAIGVPAPGRFVQLDPRTLEHRTIPIGMGGQDWGDPDCAPPQELVFSTHGLGLHERTDGALELLGINHLHRESVELFEVGREQGGLNLTWRGCLLAPDGESNLNDVTVAQDGTVIFTSMYVDGTPIWQLLLEVLLGMDTGKAWVWSAGEGYRELPHSAGSITNGVTTGDDPDMVYLNVHNDHEMRAINFRTGELVATYDVPGPDNVHADGGKLYIASHEFGSVEGLGCGERRTTCPLPYGVHVVDQKTMQGAKVWGGGGMPFGTATVAVPHDGWLWMGSYVGDRLARVPLSELARH